MHRDLRQLMKSELCEYLHTLLHLNPSILVIVHHLMDAPQGLQAVAIRLAHTWWSHYHAGVYMGHKGNVITSIII